MFTNREAVSKVENSLRGVNKDGRIPPRYILKVLRDTAKVLIAQKLLDRNLTSEESLYTSISCIDFEKIEVVKCPLIEFRMCKVLMKSKKPLPAPIYSRLGSSIRDITSLDSSFDFELLPSQQYRRNKKRKYQLKDRVYIYIDSENYLYIPEEEIYTINLKLITQETEKTDFCNTKDCKDYWDEKFVCPDRLLDAVFKDAVQLIASTYKAVNPDQNPNGVENA